MTRRDDAAGGRLQIGMPAGFALEHPAGFELECMAGFVGIRKYALRDASKPMGVAEYRVSLPPQLEAALPTPQDLEREFPQWSVVQMRIDIERAVVDLARVRGLEGDAPTLRQVLDWLRQNGGLPQTSGDLGAALTTIYGTVHGAGVDQHELHDALATGAEFLEVVRKMLSV